MAGVIIVHQPRPGQNWGPGREPASVRDAWDAHLQARQQTEPEHENQAEAG